MIRTTKLPIPYHPRATDEMVVEAIAAYMRDAQAAALPGAWPIIVARLREAYGTKRVDRAVSRYMRELRQENRSLKRQVKHARAAWIKRQTSG